MRKLRINFLVYCVTNFIWAAVFNLWYSFLPKFYEALGASVMIVGFLFSLEKISEGSSSIFGGFFADKYGRKRVIIFGSILGNISLLILYFATDWRWLIPAIAFFWITVGIQFPTVAALISESLPKKRRASAFSVLSLMNLVPAALTVSVGGWFIEKVGLVNGIKTSLAISFVVGVFLSLVYVLLLRESLRTPKKARIRVEWKIPRKILCFMLSYGLLMFSVSLISPFVIFYSQDVIGISMLEWGIVRSVFTLFFLVATVAGGLLSDRFGRRAVLLLSFISILFPVLLILSKSLIQVMIAHVFAASLAFGLSSVPVYVFEESKSAESIGIVNFCLAVAMVLGYPMGGFLYSLSPESPFMVSSLFRTLGLIIGILLI